MDRLTVTEKKDVLLQTMACVGNYPIVLECLAHDCGFSKIETVCLLALAIIQHPNIKHCEQGYYIDED